VDELASRTKINASALFRLRALEMFTQAAPRVLVNTATSECLLSNSLEANYLEAN
jgi:hypothetical protein